jgi:hypothetical protein
MLAKFKEGQIGDSAHVVLADLYERVIYCCVIGSQAYGLAESASDVDRRATPKGTRSERVAGIGEWKRRIARPVGESTITVTRCLLPSALWGMEKKQP